MAWRRPANNPLSGLMFGLDCLNIYVSLGLNELIEAIMMTASSKAITLTDISFFSYIQAFNQRTFHFS